MRREVVSRIESPDHAAMRIEADADVAAQPKQLRPIAGSTIIAQATTNPAVLIVSHTRAPHLSMF